MIFQFLMAANMKTNIAVIFLMAEALSTSETSVNLYQTTQHNIPEDSQLHFKVFHLRTSFQVLSKSVVHTSCIICEKLDGCTDMSVSKPQMLAKYRAYTRNTSYGIQVESLPQR
jgi:hypothetical protein